MAYVITGSETLVNQSIIYKVDISANATITIPEPPYDYEFYTLIRSDTNAVDATIVLDNTTLVSGESSFKLYNSSNVTLMSLNGVWELIAGYTKDR